MKKQAGFTAIELLVVVALFIFIGVVFFVQKNDLDKTAADLQRKTAVNAMYYDLTKVFYPENKYYPSEISSKNLTAIDPDLFTDPNGYTLVGDKCTYEDVNGDTQTDGSCEYHYSGVDCDGGGKCRGFKITADMQKEAEYVKTSDSKN